MSHSSLRPQRRDVLAAPAHRAIEALEWRMLLTTAPTPVHVSIPIPTPVLSPAIIPPQMFVVTNTQNSGAGSLSAAITSSNTNGAAANTIDFDIPTSDPGFSGGLFEIAPATALPTITTMVDIDGTTQPGYASTPIIALGGNFSPFDGLDIAASGCVIKGFQIENLDGYGIDLKSGATGATIAGNYIFGDAPSGILISSGAGDDTIGGSAAADSNKIFGNGTNLLPGDGIEDDGSGGNLIEGNFIGTNLAGTAAYANAVDGISIGAGAGDDTIGGSAAGDGNVISGNSLDGIHDVNGNTLIEGNFIGTNAAGTAPIGNGFDGISGINGGITIGGGAAGDGNVISGNAQEGIDDGGGNDLIEGNFIGTNAAGTIGISNGDDGVGIFGAAGNDTIGGAAVADRNVISGNGGNGIEDDGGGGNLVEGNFIGTNATGTIAVSNNLDGISIAGAAGDDTIGGGAAADRNVISGNSGDGIEDHGSGNNLIEGNFIGTNAAGTAEIANANTGVVILGNDDTIGGGAAGDRNVISGNGINGIEGDDTSGNLIEGNFIGTNAAGTAAIANAGGILFQTGGGDNTIGGSSAGDGNVISGNGGEGIYDIDGGRDLIEGNFIGTNAAGTAAIPNGGDGVLVSSSGNFIGPGNVISGNLGDGIDVVQAANSDIAGNLIGTNAAGTAAIGNGGWGVNVSGGASSNQIGGTAGGAGNVIAYNKFGGVGLAGTGSVNGAAGNLNAIRANSIYGNGGLGIDLNEDGVTSNSSGGNPQPGKPNDLQNFPVLLTATPNPTSTTVTGNILWGDDTSLFIDFYSNPTLGPGGSEQGKTYLGAIELTTNTTGNASFSATLPSVPLGQFITATATTALTSPTGDTSEFSGPVQVTADTTPPTAALQSAPAITTANNSAEVITVGYSDKADVNASTLGNGNLLITGPNGYSKFATLTSTGLANAPTLVGTYTAPAPVGGWSSAYDGTFTVTLESNQVANTSGIFASAGALGTFNVNITAPVTPTPPAPTASLMGVQSTAASSYNLTTQGPTDWIHWGRGGVFGHVDRKAGGNLISGVTEINPGGAGFGGYTDPSRTVTWTNGSPTASNSGDHGYIWANDAIGAGYSFTVPASTTTQTLYVYAGGYSSGATLTAHLSGGSVADYVASAWGTGHYSQLYTITFKAASAGQKLTITYVKTKNINGTGGSADLISAALDPPAADTTPPKAVVETPAVISTSSASPYTFSIDWTDNVAVSAATLGNQNLLITGPDGYSRLATLLSSNLANGSSVVAQYSVAAPSGGWTSGDDGTYTIAVQADQVADTSGNYVAAGSVGSFSVLIPRAVSGATPVTVAPMGVVAV